MEKTDVYRLDCANTSAKQMCVSVWVYASVWICVGELEKKITNKGSGEGDYEPQQLIMYMGIYKYKIQLIIRILLHYRLFILKSASFDIRTFACYICIYSNERWNPSFIRLPKWVHSLMVCWCGCVLKLEVYLDWRIHITSHICVFRRLNHEAHCAH